MFLFLCRSKSIPKHETDSITDIKQILIRHKISLLTRIDYLKEQKNKEDEIYIVKSLLDDILFYLYTSKKNIDTSDILKVLLKINIYFKYQVGY